MDPLHDQPSLALARYRFSFTAEQSFRLPEFAGSAWRGAFGHALKRLVCVTREPLCAKCLLYRSCSYPYVFETPPDTSVGMMTKYTAAPHPYVLLPGPRRGPVEAGGQVTLGLALFGHAIRQLPYIVHALTQAGVRGLTAARTPLTLQEVWQWDGADDWRLIYRPGETLRPLEPVLPDRPSCPEALTLKLGTPLRVKRGGHFVTPDTFDFAALFSGLLRRISMLMAFHGGTMLNADFAALSRQAKTVPLRRAELYWREYTRYSSRQQTSMQQGGVVGDIELDGSGLEPFWPYLWLGQWTHAGKGTSMGLGCYRIISKSLTHGKLASHETADVLGCNSAAGHAERLTAQGPHNSNLQEPPPCPPAPIAASCSA